MDIYIMNEIFSTLEQDLLFAQQDSNIESKCPIDFFYLIRNESSVQIT